MYYRRILGSIKARLRTTEDREGILWEEREDNNVAKFSTNREWMDGKHVLIPRIQKHFHFQHCADLNLNLCEATDLKMPGLSCGFSELLHLGHAWSSLAYRHQKYQNLFRTHRAHILHAVILRRIHSLRDKTRLNTKGSNSCGNELKKKLL